MIRLIAKRLAIGKYVKKLSPELLRRFGKKRFYSIEEVTQAARRSSQPMAFIAYAHAIFCSQTDFDAYYVPLGIACTYDGLRTVVSRRFFGGRCDFDAANIIAWTKPRDGYFYESGAGFDLPPFS